MKTFWLLLFLFLTQVHALEHEIQFENDHVCISRVVIGPNEIVGLHRDTLPHVVIALDGGVITRLEADGREVDVAFPTGEAVYRPVDPESQLHRTINKSDKAVELIIVQMKSNTS